MQSLLLTCDERVQACDWLLHAQAFLRAERLVLAITDRPSLVPPKDSSNAAGSAETRLPVETYASIFGNPIFVLVRVHASSAQEAASSIADKLRRMPREAVVIWDLCPYEKARMWAGWDEVVDTMDLRAGSGGSKYYSSLTSWRRGETHRMARAAATTR